MQENKSRVVKMTIYDISVNEVYPLVEKFGPRGLEDLSVHLISDEINYPEVLDAARIVAACPKIKSLTIDNKGDYQEGSPYMAQVTPEHFTNCHTFHTDIIGDVQGWKYLSELDKMWVLGSRAFGKRCLKLEKFEQIEQVLSVLQLKVPTALDEVESVDFIVSSYEGEQLEKLLQVVFLLILRSPNLQLLSFRNYYQIPDLQAPKWLQRIMTSLQIQFENTRRTSRLPF